MKLREYSNEQIIAALNKAQVNPWASKFKKTERPKVISAMKSLDPDATYGNQFDYELSYDWMSNRILKLRIWGPTPDDPECAYRNIVYGG